MFYAFDNAQPATSDSDRTAPPVLALGVFGARRTFASRRSFDATPKIRRTIDSHHHGKPLVASASENSSMRRRMAASLNRPTAWRRRGVARTAFPGAEELGADDPWVGCGSATRAGSRGCRCARGAAAARSSCHCPVFAPFNLSGLIEAFNEGFSCLEIVHRCASFRPDALPTGSWSRGPGGRTL